MCHLILIVINDCVCLPFAQNAFSKNLAELGFCVFLMLVVDLMHEIELGVWKMLFIHLLRILDCADEGLKNELDKRHAFLYIHQQNTGLPCLC
jgi:hypothetical protein